jgi:hypothetical protein
VDLHSVDSFLEEVFLFRLKVAFLYVLRYFETALSSFKNVVKGRVEPRIFQIQLFTLRFRYLRLGQTRDLFAHFLA